MEWVGCPGIGSLQKVLASLNTVLCTLGEGTSEIQRLVIARQLLRD